MDVMEQTCGQHSKEGNYKPELPEEEPPQLSNNSEGQTLKIIGMAYHGIHLLCVGSTYPNLKPVEPVMLQLCFLISSGIHSNKGGSRAKTVMLYRIVHKLVFIPITPFLIPARKFRSHNMRFLIPQSTGTAQTINRECAVLLLPKCHPYLELAAIFFGLSTQLIDLQGPAAIQHHVHIDLIQILPCI